ncbi:MAG: hypothetical protein RIS97_1500 [Pseudomonadota bacterium]|jgi:hypothetical protein
MTTPTKAPTKTSVKATTQAATKPATKPATKAPTTVAKPAMTLKNLDVKVKTEAPKAISKPAVQALIEKPLKAKKIKLVRDSFTIPKPEYLILDNLKLRAADLKHPVKKSELLRAGIKALAAMTDSNLLTALKAVPMLKTGRPSK